MFRNDEVERSFCCRRRCFRAPRTQVDGMACDKCHSFSYCRCLCETYRESHPRVNDAAVTGGSARPSLDEVPIDVAVDVAVDVKAQFTGDSCGVNVTMFRATRSSLLEAIAKLRTVMRQRSSECTIATHDRIYGRTIDLIRELSVCLADVETLIRYMSNEVDRRV